MFQAAESFLVNCIDKSKSKCNKFDELRVIRQNTYSRDLDLNLMPCSSSALREHIKRAYLQANSWITATTRDRLRLENKESYGWSFSETILVPALLPEGLLTRPSNLPEPCKCGVCRFETRCKCRIHKLKCCRYCVCSKDNKCENPY